MSVKVKIKIKGEDAEDIANGALSVANKDSDSINSSAGLSGNSLNLRAGSWQRPVPPTVSVTDAKQDDAAMNAGHKTNLGVTESGTHKGIFQDGEVGKMTDQPEAPHGRSYPGRALPKNK